MIRDGDDFISHCWVFLNFIYLFFKIFIVIQLQLYAFSGFEDGRGQQAKECGWPSETGKGKKKSDGSQ